MASPWSMCTERWAYGDKDCDADADADAEEARLFSRETHTVHAFTAAKSETGNQPTARSLSTIDGAV